MAARPTGLYRTMLRVAKGLPKDKRAGVVADIKATWEQHKQETDPLVYVNAAAARLAAVVLGRGAHACVRVNMCVGPCVTPCSA